MTIRKEFEDFMSHTFPSVERNSSQWDCLELTWNASALLTTTLVFKGGKESLMMCAEESNAYCKSVYEEILENQKSNGVENDELNH